MSDWRIQFSRTGGIAGMTVSATVDPSTASPEEARVIEQTLNAVDLGALAVRDAGTPYPDGYRYDLVVDSGGTRQELHFSDPAVPEQLAPLIRLLTRRAMKQS